MRGRGQETTPTAPRARLAVVCTALACLVTAGALTAPGADAAKAAKRSKCKVAATTPPEGPSADAAVVQRASDGTPQVSMVRYPRPDRDPGGSNPWSQWGQGLVLADGRFLSAMGDHAGVDGNSYLFVFDPATKRLTRFGDVLSKVDHPPGTAGFGKIHGQIVAGRCGDAYFATYWGDADDVVYRGSYRGDLLFRIDLATLAYEPLGVPVEGHGIPSLAGLGDGLLYGEAVDPEATAAARRPVGAFFVYDTRTREVVFRSDDRGHVLFRNVIVDRQGRAYVARGGGGLLVYEPGAGELRATDQKLPGGGDLRASTVPTADGTVYGVTQGSAGASKGLDQIFALSPDGSIRSIGAARGYTTSLAMERDGSRIYYVPAAHGGGDAATPVIAVDTRTGEESVVARLGPLAEEHLGLSLAGSYDVTLDAKRRTLYVGLNAGETRDDPWNEVVLAVIDLPRP